MQNDLPVPIFPAHFLPKEQIRQPPENIKLKHHEARKQRRHQPNILTASDAYVALGIKGSGTVREKAGLERKRASSHATTHGHLKEDEARQEHADRCTGSTYCAEKLVYPPPSHRDFFFET